jgi:hypothetical protein
MDRESLRAAYCATCGIGYLDPNSEWGPTPPADGRLPNVVIKGTGFVASHGLIATARHVLDGLHKTGIDIERQLVVVLTNPSKQVGQIRFLRGFNGYLTVSHTEQGEFTPDMDYAFLPLPAGWEAVQPIVAAPQDAQHVLDEVVAVGYHSGQTLLNAKGLGSNRWGPLTLAGRISAISPIGLSSKEGAKEFLLDMTAAGGMSGAPVLDSSGAVFAMVVAGIERLIENEQGDRIGTAPLNIARALPFTAEIQAKLPQIREAFTRAMPK